MDVREPCFSMETEESSASDALVRGMKRKENSLEIMDDESPTSSRSSPKRVKK